MLQKKKFVEINWDQQSAATKATSLRFKIMSLEMELEKKKQLLVLFEAEEKLEQEKKEKKEKRERTDSEDEEQADVVKKQKPEVAWNTMDFNPAEKEWDQWKDSGVWSGVWKKPGQTTNLLTVNGKTTETNGPVCIIGDQVIIGNKKGVTITTTTTTTNGVTKEFHVTHY